MTDPTPNPNEIPQWVLDQAAKLTEPLGRDPVVGWSETPSWDRLQRWRQDASVHGFDPDEVRLVFDPESGGFGVQVPDALLDQILGAFW